jgi:hypothetical protein
MRFEILTALKMWFAVFWEVANNPNELEGHKFFEQ